MCVCTHKSLYSWVCICLINFFYPHVLCNFVNKHLRCTYLHANVIVNVKQIWSQSVVQMSLANADMSGIDLPTCVLFSTHTDTESFILTSGSNMCTLYKCLHLILINSSFRCFLLDIGGQIQISIPMLVLVWILCYYTVSSLNCVNLLAAK